MTVGPRLGWSFSRVAAGSVASSGLTNLLEGTHLTESERFVREAIQNSVDARIPDAKHPVEVRISRFRPPTSTAAALLDMLHVDGQLARRVPLFGGVDGFPEGGAFLGSAPDEPRPTTWLTFEDFGTRGLGGALRGQGADDHFARLVYFFGNSHGSDGDQGGAFGFGKSVHSNASAIRTVVYYSRPVDLPSRLIVVSLFPRHTLDGVGYLGYATFGVDSGDPAFPTDPLVGEQADRVAGSLGLQVRDDDTTGTSLLVVDCPYDLGAVRAATEKWWWPRLVTTGPDSLTVRLFDEGTEVDGPRPRSRDDLEPFIKAYLHLLDTRSDATDVATHVVQSVGKKVVGRLALRKLDAADAPPSERPDDDPTPEPEDTSWSVDAVATFRGPRLVVAYRPLPESPSSRIVGVFVADESMNVVLRGAENPAHDTWSPTRRDLTPQQRTWVKSIDTGIKKHAKTFRSKFEDRRVSSSRGLGPLEEALGRLMTTGKRPGPPPKAEPRPVSISLTQRRNLDIGTDEAVIVISGAPGYGTVGGRLHVQASLLGDGRATVLEKLGVVLADGRGTDVAEGMEPTAAFEVDENSSVRFVARTTSRSDSLVRFTVSATGSVTP